MKYLKKYKSTFKFINNKFILFLRKDVYLFEHMDEWKTLNQKSSLKKKNYIAIYVWRKLQMNIYHTKRVSKDFEKKIQMTVMISVLKAIY